VPEDSPIAGLLCTMWDETKGGVRRGSVEVRL